MRLTPSAWVSNQRNVKDQILPERKQRLDDLGFVWNTISEKWEEGFAALARIIHV